MNAAQYRRSQALLASIGFEDVAALTAQSPQGGIPHGRELSIAWLTGTVLTGLTSVLLMGAALYVAFEGQDTFSTAYEALKVGEAPAPQNPTNLLIKTNRVRPVTQTRSELEIIEASIKERVGGRDIVRKEPFSRLHATLATAATSLSGDVPTYDPAALMTSLDESIPATSDVSTDVYGAEVEGEVSIKLSMLPAGAPPRTISDQQATEFVRQSLFDVYLDSGSSLSAYAPGGFGTDASSQHGARIGIAENVTILPKTTLSGEGLGRTERLLTLREDALLEYTLRKNGFTERMIAMISVALRNVFPDTNLPAGTRLRILFGPSRASDSLVPYRMSIYLHGGSADTYRHAATVALTDRGQYVLATEPPRVAFPKEDTEEINVANLPSMYRSLWETGRKHDLDDDTISKIIALFAYDLDLTRKVAPGDMLEVLQTTPDAAGKRELLYVGLRLGSSMKERFRFLSPDGTVSFFDPNGESGKRFLTRRPLQGGGVVRSPFGYRIHPIFRKRQLHSGVDLAAPTGTPIYASGDGIIEKAGWSSGYGKYVKIKHVNGFETGYAHMSRINEAMKPGVRVRQGQVIGYVGSTGNSTGPHLHFEIVINGNFVDPLAVKLPKDKTLPAQYEGRFAESVAQIRDLMQRAPSPRQSVASNR